MNTTDQKQARRRRVGVTPGNVIAFFLAVSLSVGLLSAPVLERYFQKLAGLRSKATLQLTVEVLSSTLQRYEPTPSLIAERPNLAQLLRAPADLELRRKANEGLRLAAFRLEASDVYLMDATGLTLAASNYLKDRSFVGRSFAFRPYFTQALEGGTGRFFALGTTSGERGYFFAAPVIDSGRIAGVVAVKFTVEGFEEAWRSADHQIIVSDQKDVVFMASRPDWHFRTLRPLSDLEQSEILAYRQYPADRLMPLTNTVEALEEGLSLVRIDDGGQQSSYISSFDTIQKADWKVRILVPAAQASTQTVAALLILVLVIMLIGLAVAFYVQRRAQLLERLKTQQMAQEQLEIRVTERTADLNRSNEKLLEEIAERKTAEDRLRKTQTELVQAGKLAALGQMSAALSHEFNQPLAAVKSYADNALKLLDVGRADETRENIGRISTMADRMAAISKHLRNFARRPMEKVRPVPLVQIVNDAIALLEPRLKTTKTRVDFAPPEGDVWVMGGHIRLQQVVVNLLSNALDAMRDNAQGTIEVTLEARDDCCVLGVRDQGPGVCEDDLGKVFDPFFSTKQPGEGMGLGLSISYNIIKDFNGYLRVRNHPGGGAVFEIELQKPDRFFSDSEHGSSQNMAAE